MTLLTATQIKQFRRTRDQPLVITPNCLEVRGTGSNPLTAWIIVIAYSMGRDTPASLKAQGWGMQSTSAAETSPGMAPGMIRAWITPGLGMDVSGSAFKGFPEVSLLRGICFSVGFAPVFRRPTCPMRLFHPLMTRPCKTILSDTNCLKWAIPKKSQMSLRAAAPGVWDAASFLPLR